MAARLGQSGASHPPGSRLLAAPASSAHPARLSQVGEFSFILAEMGRDLSLVSVEGQKLILCAALISITLNPLLFVGIDWVRKTLEARNSDTPPPRTPEPVLG